MQKQIALRDLIPRGRKRVAFEGRENGRGKGTSVINPTRHWYARSVGKAVRPYALISYE